MALQQGKIASKWYRAAGSSTMDSGSSASTSEALPPVPGWGSHNGSEESVAAPQWLIGVPNPWHWGLPAMSTKLTRSGDAYIIYIIYIHAYIKKYIHMYILMYVNTRTYIFLQPFQCWMVAWLSATSPRECHPLVNQNQTLDSSSGIEFLLSSSTLLRMSS